MICKMEGNNGVISLLVNVKNEKKMVSTVAGDDVFM